MDAYELLVMAYKGWTLADARALTASERRFFLGRAGERAQRRSLEDL